MMLENTMLRIEKFVVPCSLHDIREGGPVKRTTVEVPWSTQFISISTESDHIVLWGLMKSRAIPDQTSKRCVVICPPGTDIPDDIALHYGGAVLVGGTHVHVFLENFVQHRMGPSRVD